MASKVNIVINGKNLASKAIKDVTKDLSSARGASDKLNDGMMKLAKFGLGTAIAGLGASVAASFASLRKSADFSDVRMQFETLLGGYKEAEEMLTNLQNLSAKTPLQLTAVTDAATQLLAVGTEKSLITDELRMLGDLAMGNEQKFGLLTDAYSKLRAKGKVTLEELNRFTENGVPLLGKMAENLGVSNAELQKMVSSGKIKLKDIQGAMKDLTEEGGMFFEMMEKKSQGVNGKLSTLRDNLSMTMIKWGSAFEPLAGSLLDTAIKKLEEFSTSDSFKSFVDTTVRWASWAASAIPKVGLTVSMIAALIGTTVKEAKEQLEAIGSVVIKTPIVQAAIELAGDTWDALKKGFTTGDWSDALGVGSDLLKAGITVYASLLLIDGAAKVLTGLVVQGLLASGLASAPKNVGIPGVIAMASIAIGLVEAVKTGDYEAFGNNLALALAAGLGIGYFTKSPEAGTLAFSIVMNLQWGDKVLDFSDFHPIQDIKGWFENPQSLADSLRSSFIDIWRMSGVYAWLQGYGNDIGEDFGNNLLDSFLGVIGVFDLVGAFKDLWDFYLSPLADYMSENGKKIGENFINALWDVISIFDLVGAFKDLWDFYLSPLIKDISENGIDVGENFIEGFKQGIANIWDSAIGKVGSFFSKVLGISKKTLDERSPSKEAASIGSFFVLGFTQGMSKEMTSSEKLISKFPQGVIDTFRKVLGVHSPSDVTDEIGQWTAIGFIEGFGDMTYMEKLRAIVALYNEKLSELGNVDWEETAEDIINEFFPKSGNSGPAIEGFWNGFFSGIKDAYSESGLKSAIGNIANSAQSLFGGIFTGMSDDIGFFFSAMINKISNTGFGKFIGKAGSFVGGVAESVGSFFSSVASKIANLKVGGSTIGDRAGGAFAAIAPLLGKLGSGLASSIASLSTVQAILDPIGTILSGAMSVLEPLINKALAPLLGILTIVGKTIGTVLSPVLEFLATVTEALGRGFVWFYNKAIVPVANGFIMMFNAIRIGFARIINGIIRAINRIPFVNVGYVTVPDIDSGTLSAIDYSALTASASSYTGSSTAGGSSSSVQQVTINYHQTINGNVIGDSGLSELGEFFVKAVEAYIGSGGTVKFIQETA